MLAPNKCKCGLRIIEPIGNIKSRILIVGEYPNFLCFKTWKPFSQDAGEVLKSELARIGIALSDCRLTNMWRHAPSETCPLDLHMKDVLKEGKERRYILFMGNLVAQELFGGSALSLSGLRLSHELFPKSRIMVLQHPATILGKGATIGEFRLALQKLALWMEEK